jgi:hypothetical protein
MVLRSRSLPVAAAIAWANSVLKTPSVHHFSAILVQKFSQRSLEVFLDERSELLHRRI